MKAYSLDLRQKILDVYNEGNISQRQLAKLFHVSLSFIQKILKQYRKTGNIAPQVRSQQTPTKLNSSQLNVLENIVLKNHDATLEELRLMLAEETGVFIGRSTVDRMIERLNLPRKKNTKRIRKRNRQSSKTTVRLLGKC
jgi:transposase